MRTSVQLELEEQLSELFVLSAALYFRRERRDDANGPKARDDVLHQTASRLIALGGDSRLGPPESTIQVLRGMKELAEGLLDTSFMARSCGEESTAQELALLSEAVMAEMLT